MDGINGIAGIEAISVLGGAALILYGHQESLWVLVFLLSAPVLGFLVWNFPKAYIFMGDAGSAFLGGFLALFGVFLVDHTLLNIWAWLILLGVFVV